MDPRPQTKINWKNFGLKTQYQIKNSRISNIFDINKEITNHTKIIQLNLENCAYPSNHSNANTILSQEILLKTEIKRIFCNTF